MVDIVNTITKFVTVITFSVTMCFNVNSANPNIADPFPHETIEQTRRNIAVLRNTAGEVLEKVNEAENALNQMDRFWDENPRLLADLDTDPEGVELAINAIAESSGFNMPMLNETVSNNVVLSMAMIAEILENTEHSEYKDSEFKPDFSALENYALISAGANKDKVAASITQMLLLSRLQKALCFIDLYKTHSEAGKPFIIALDSESEIIPQEQIGGIESRVIGLLRIGGELSGFMTDSHRLFVQTPFGMIEASLFCKTSEALTVIAKNALTEAADCEFSEENSAFPVRDFFARIAVSE